MSLDDDRSTDVFDGVLEEDANDPFLQHDYDHDREAGRAVFIDGMDVVLDRERRAHAVAPGDDLARVALEEQELRAKAAQESREAPQISGAPPSAIKGIMGGEVAVSASDPTPRSIASWTADLDAESRPVIISVGPTPQVTAVTSGIQLRAFARIRYGTQRGFLYVDVDIGSGITLTVPASAVEVLIGLDSGSGLSNYSVTVAIAFGLGVRTTILPRTAYLDGIGAGAANLVNIVRPVGAVELAAFERATVGSAYQLDFKDVQGTIRYSRVITANNYLLSPVFLANDIASIDVTNNGSSTDQARVVFGIGVG